MNLTLRLLGLREDGYHEVETVLQALALHDELVVRPAPAGISLEIDFPSEGHAAGFDVPTGPENLVCRAARKFISEAAIETGVEFFLRKRIPPGAGLGGGSSDAAAALLLLDELFDRPLDRQALMRLAGGLGADVPFFLEAGRQLGKGIGDQLTPLVEEQPLHFLLILPPFGCSTAAVYEKQRARLTAISPSHKVLEVKGGSHKGLEIPEGLVNDLESVAMELHPELEQLVARVRAAGCPDVRMSGSGSALFVASTSEARIREAEMRLAWLCDEGVATLCTSSDRREPVAKRPCSVAWPGKDRSEEGQQ